MDIAGAAKMFAQQPKGIKALRATVTAFNSDGSLSVVIDGSVNVINVGKACNPDVGSRVVVLVDGTLWTAIATIGGEVIPQPAIDYIVDRYTTGDSWQVTRWASGLLEQSLEKDITATTATFQHPSFLNCYYTTPQFLGYYPIQFVTLRQVEMGFRRINGYQYPTFAQPNYDGSLNYLPTVQLYNPVQNQVLGCAVWSHSYGTWK